MKQISILFFFFSFLALSANAQLKAVTSNGDEVILNNDGTWKYAKDPSQQADETLVKVDTSKTRFAKTANASFLLKSSRVDYGVYVDPKKWSFVKSGENEASEYDFTLKAKDAYAMLITEKIEIPMTSLKKAALANAQAVSPDIQIVKEEYRYVNGKLVLLLQMDGTVSGVKFSYLGYYFSSSKGTVQLLTYTATNLLNQFKTELEGLLNGFVEL